MKKILIVNANYYKDISSNLIYCAKKKLNDHKFKVSIINVPGIFEIPVTIIKYIRKFDGFLALGCVIKGQTPHFNFISKSTFDAIMNISVNFSKPVGNGIITSLNMKQALDRSLFNKKLLMSNKGSEAANAVISVLINEPKKI